MSLGLVFVFLWALASVTVAEDTPRCPEGFVQHGSSCYWFSTIAASFAEARSYCQFLGSHLARITNEDEDAFLRSRARNEGSEGYWLGATELITEGKFVWEGGFPLNYTNWHSGEPDRGTQRCVMLYRDFGYEWNDYGCVEDINFICERRVSTCCCNN